MKNLIGQILGKYRVETELSNSQMAHVFKAYRPDLDRYAAIKVLNNLGNEAEDFLMRFKREATVVARLRHSNIVQIHDFDIEDETAYMVMEFLEGITLKDEIAKRKKKKSSSAPLFSLNETINIFTPLANAIDYAHQRGVIHRDLKPANIMITLDEEIILMDFGLARILDASKETIGFLGTPIYMAPEQAGWTIYGEITKQADIYSLGVIAYEMLVGRPPFDGDMHSLLQAHVYTVPPSPLQFVPGMSQELSTALLQALEKQPSQRYQSATAFLLALQNLVAKHSTDSSKKPIQTLINVASKPYLQCVKTGTRFPIMGRSALIGRADDLHINLADLPDSDVTSRKHANIWYTQKEEYWIKDERSLNGTIVNGVILGDGKRTQLEDGDRIQFGVDGTILTFHRNESG